MDNVRIKKLEEKEALLRDTFEDLLLSLERNSEVSIEQVKLMRCLADVWLGARELVECERKMAGEKSALKL